MLRFTNILIVAYVCILFISDMFEYVSWVMTDE